MNIIALYGRHNSGKSFTLNSLYMHMLYSGYTQVPNHFKDLGGNYDFLDVLTKDGITLIGIVARGDVGQWLAGDLQTLANAGCSKTICACLTSGATNVAINVYPNQYIPKTKTNLVSQHRFANFQDVITLYNLL